MAKKRQRIDMLIDAHVWLRRRAPGAPAFIELRLPAQRYMN